MKIKIKHDLLVVNILNVILIFIVVVLPSSLIRIVLGIPFIFFFSGYTTLSALHPAKDTISNFNRLMLSFALSIAIVTLILLLLNFTTWGIKLNTIIYSIAAFTAIVSAIAWLRRRRKPESVRFNIEFTLIPGWKIFWEKSRWDFIISIVLVFTIVGTITIVFYVVKKPDSGEKYTEFYILGTNGKAIDYPQTLTLGENGEAIVGVVNHEQVPTIYTVEVTINNVEDNETDPITLVEGQEWEKMITFTPTKVATNQKVEFLLYEDGNPEPSMGPLYLWIDVSQ